MQKRVILMAAGGTGGHVFPALAIAQAFRARGHHVIWLGTAKGIEATVVPQAGIVLEQLTVTGLRGKGLFSWLLAPFQLMRALAQALRVIQKYKPDLVMGFGGFVCGPTGVAAFLSRTPLVLHEQNAIPGMTNRCLKPLAVKVLTSFPDVFKPGKKVMMTGNPVRSEITTLPSPPLRFSEHTGDLRILVLGGSLGALCLNQTVPAALQQLNAPVVVRHQCGVKTLDAAQKAYEATQLNYQIVPFIDDMAQAYAWADIVICRAGATTIAELIAAGLGAILVPYPYAVDDHQTANGLYLVKSGGAELVQQKELTPALLAEKIRMFGDRAQCLERGLAAHNLYQGDAVQKIIYYCEELLSGQS
jgi:UDP-N-acetylglucosamine--N-acetylmuramyl-(pentapeptide) pyrophosphoryl-undecaprenol N-acetylglucosamine transferase